MLDLSWKTSIFTCWDWKNNC